MAFLKYWQIAVMIALIVLSVVFIHPFNSDGVMISTVHGQASVMIRAGDVLTKINDEPLKSIDDYESILSKIQPNDTVSVGVKRETFPYAYKDFNHLYITGESNGNADLAFSVKPLAFSNVKYDNELAGGNQFIIRTSDTKATKEVLIKRFAITKVFDYTFSEANGNLVLNTIYGKEITPIIENKGKFEAKVGGELFFDNNDIERYCISGVDCLINFYPKLTKDGNETSVDWKYGFETKITKEAAERFVNLTETLSIASCEYDTCLLNDSIKYYLDGEYIGSEEIYAEAKGKENSKPFVGGLASTKDDAEYMLQFTQAALVGETDADIKSVEPVGPSWNKNIIVVSMAIILVIAFTGAGFATYQLRGAQIFASGLFTNIAEPLIVLGMMSGLNTIIKPMTLFTLVGLSLLSAIYKNYIVVQIKKESFVLKKMNEIDSKLNWVFIGGLVLSVIIMWLVPAIGWPLMMYLIVVLILSKSIFIDAIKEKR
jgi:hypothetical protein